MRHTRSTCSLSGASTKPNARMMSKIFCMRTKSRSRPTLPPKSSTYTMRADTRPLARTALAVTAVKRQNTLALVVRPNGSTL